MLAKLGSGSIDSVFTNVSKSPHWYVSISWSSVEGGPSAEVASGSK